MPVKPTVTFTIATNANYAAGPFTGSATKVAPPTADGYVPGTIIDAEHHNFVGNAAGQWITNWVFLGTSAADEDAHLMETDSDGFNATARMVLGGTSASSFALSVTENSNATGTAAEFTNTGAGFAVNAAAASTLAAVKGTCTGSGPGVQGVNIGGGGVGVLGTGDGSAAGVSGVGDSGGTGTGVEGAGSPGGGDGVSGSCTFAATAGVRGQGHASNTGTTGVIGITTQSDGLGVAGFNLFAGASPTNPSQSGVLGSSTDGTGVFASSTNGYGCLAQSDTTSPTRAPLRVVPQDADPTSKLNGDVTYNSTEDVLKVVETATWQIIHTSINGLTHGHAFGASGSRNGVAFISFNSINLTPKKAGTVILSVTGSFRNVGDESFNTVEVQIWDSTLGTQVAVTEIYLSQTNTDVTTGTRPNSYETTIALHTPYILPDATTRTFQVRIASHTGGSTGIDFAKLVITGEGVF